ncbi:MAG: DUF4827 domain-containing protein [Tannerella sp.]|nr:DUF4827 domain-containing protein [Tannerella sp.]
MKTKICLLMMIVSAVFVSSCGSNVPTYEELKRNEDRAIDRLIAKEGFEILNDYPVNGVFGEKQFVELDNGVLLNVVDSGNGNRPELGKTTILMRCSGKFLFEEDSVNSFTTFPNWHDPIEFIYGLASVAISQHSQSIGSSNTWYYLSPGVESVLVYVGENAIVKLIVPFEQGSSFQKYDSYNPSPLYFDKIKFTFY